MLQLLQEQYQERRLRAGPLAISLLRDCGSVNGGSSGGNKAIERAQITVHEALRLAKVTNGQGSSREIYAEQQISYTGGDNGSTEQLTCNGSHHNGQSSKRAAGTQNSADKWHGEDQGSDFGGKGRGSVHFQHQQVASSDVRPRSKLERHRDALLSSVLEVTK